VGQPPDTLDDTEPDDTEPDDSADSDDTGEPPRVEPVPRTHDPRDYGYLFWPGNHWTTWNTYNPVRYVQTGFYGLSLDVTQGSLGHLGLLTDGLDRVAARHADNATITDLPSADLALHVELNGVRHAADAFRSDDGSTSNPSRLIDMGRFMQQVEIPDVGYAGADVGGVLHVAAMPRHLVLTQRITPAAQTDDLTLQVQLSGDAVRLFPHTTVLDGDRALSVLDDDGQGWSFILPAGVDGAIGRTSEGDVVFSAAFTDVPGGTECALSITAVPTHAASSDQLSLWLTPTDTVRVQYAQLNRDGSAAEALTDARWDDQRGLFVVDLRDLSNVGASAGLPWADADAHTWYNRHQIVVHNDTGGAVSVPLAFDGGNNAAFYIVGGSPLLRDTDGEPIGAPMQISKNWHETPFWYHTYSALELAPGEHSFEHTFAHAKWGDAYAVAHAQLSLIGWGRNQQWDESSVGAFGESITYDPDFTLGRAMVDDVRPVLVDAAGEWTWTGNVGGANFLIYGTAETDNRPDHQLSRLRTDYAATGPNLTDVTYAGVTRDGRVQATVTTQLTRTDDVVRVYYHLRYEFLEAVTYTRLALFQMAADRYGDNGFTRYAYGDADQVVFDGAVHEHGTTGYASAADRGIALDGPSPWVWLYASDLDTGSLPEHLANVGFVVRDYAAVLGDETVTTPHINVVLTHNGGQSQMAFELGIPWDPADPTVPAGSVITATVEYVVPPSDKSRWFGASDTLSAIPAEDFQTPQMMQGLAADNALTVDAAVGSVARVHPVELVADPGFTAVDFELTGGVGYVPVTIGGLARPDGWRLEVHVDGAWERVDQSVEGSDYWQANDGVDGYQLVFNVPNRGTQRYRLVR
jgi:hypothetical protein